MGNLWSGRPMEGPAVGALLGPLSRTRRAFWWLTFKGPWVKAQIATFAPKVKRARDSLKMQASTAVATFSLLCISSMQQPLKAATIERDAGKISIQKLCQTSFAKLLFFFLKDCLWRKYCFFFPIFSIYLSGKIYDSFMLQKNPDSNLIIAEKETFQQ